MAKFSDVAKGRGVGEIPKLLYIVSGSTQASVGKGKIKIKEKEKKIYV